MTASIDLAEGTDERMRQSVIEGNDEKIIKRGAIVRTGIPGLWSVCYETLHTRYRADTSTLLSVPSSSAMSFNQVAKSIIYPLPCVVLKFDGLFLNTDAVIICWI